MGRCTPASTVPPASAKRVHSPSAASTFRGDSGRASRDTRSCCRRPTRRGGKMSGETQYVYAATLGASQMLEPRRFHVKDNPDAFVYGTEEDGQGGARLKKSWPARLK